MASAKDSLNPYSKGRTYEKQKAGAAGGAQYGLQTALAGASIGTAVGGPVGAAVGAAAGFTVGAIGGWISSSKQYSEAQKLARKQAKLAKEAAKGQFKSGISQTGADRMQDAFTNAGRVDPGIVETAGTPGSTNYDQYKFRTYGSV